MHIEELLREAIANRASDVHLRVGAPPIIRVDGRMTETNLRTLTPSDTKEAIYSLMSRLQMERFEEELELDFAYTLTGISRFRINVFREQGHVGAVFRAIPLHVQSLEELSLPPILKKFCDEPNGLVLVTGPTGSGKSTTLAAMIDYLNNTQDMHILTIEDPIEFVHRRNRCLITQREIVYDTPSFPSAIRASLRQDPDVILIGEMRDAETMMEAMRAASTGHLVLSTLHTNDAVQTINRIVQAFPPHEQEGVRHQLANVIKGAVAQRLVPHSCGIGRVLALDILVRTATVRDYIDRGKLAEIYQLIAEGAIDGMQSMNQSLMYLFRRGDITREAALEYSDTPKDLEQMMAGVMKGGMGTVY